MNNKIIWAVQSRIAQQDIDAIKSACFKFGFEFKEIDVLPFSDLPNELIELNNPLLYGSVSMIDKCLDFPNLKNGVFYNANNFTFENYIRQYGELMFNSECNIIKIKDLDSLDSPDLPDNELVFVRPNNDDKSFDGQIKSFGELKGWLSQLEVNYNNLTPETKIVISKPYNIDVEYRFWIVNGKVIAGSRYREDFRLSKSRNCPDKLVKFAEEASQMYSPHEVFVMDVCVADNQPYIFECGSFNSAGFYAANVEDIVFEVSDYRYDFYSSSTTLEVRL